MQTKELRKPTEDFLYHEMALLYCQPGNKEKQYLIGNEAPVGIYHNTKYPHPQY
jgi:hypothetical protein